MSIVRRIRYTGTNRRGNGFIWGIFQQPWTFSSSANSQSLLVLPPSSSHHRSRRHGTSTLRSLHQSHCLPPPRYEVRKHLQILLTILRSHRKRTRQEQRLSALCCRHIESMVSFMQSSTLVIAYLMRKKNWSFKEAISFVRKERPNVLPNLGFERQLK